MSLIVENSVIEELILITKRPMIQWPTVIPFILLYVVALSINLYPTTFWGDTNYLFNQSHIDFFDAALIPLVMFFHCFTSLFTVWSLKFKVNCLYRKLNVQALAKATAIFVRVRSHKGSSEIVSIQKEKADKTKYTTTTNAAPRDGIVYFFMFQERKWVFDNDKKQFVKPLFPDTLALSSYHKAEGYTKQTDINTALNTYGRNLLPLDVPEFTELLVDHAFQPFFVFQMFSVLLWCLDEYWMYSVFTGIMMVVMEATVVFQRIRNMKMLRQMGEVPIIPVVARRAGEWKTINSDQLLPLDVILVPNNMHCPADCVLVKGTCVMNEAMLTGESTPQLKEPVDNNASQYLDPRRDMRHILYGGTQTLLSSGSISVPSQNIRSAAVAVVLRTGFETKQGKLLRTILHSQGRISENSTEAFAFIGVLVVFALVASGYLLKRGLADPTKDRWKLFLHCTQIITSVVPTELPMELSLAVNTSLITLMRLRVFCTEPFRIPFAGKLDTCCFDKTGTITTDEMLFSGVDLADGAGLRFRTVDFPLRAEQVLAGCHSLVHLAGCDVAGDAMEKAAVSALGYKCSKDDYVTKEPGEGAAASAATVSYTIAARFPFNPNLRRMSTVISNANEKLVVCKGSPEGLKELCGSSVPADYDEVYQSYAAKGLRVIALAYKEVPDEYRSKMSITTIPRERAECDLIFAGFSVFNCPLKKDADATVRHLINGSHRCVVITGDNIQTALAVARMVGIAPCRKHYIARAAITADAADHMKADADQFPTPLFDSVNIVRRKGKPTEEVRMRTDEVLNNAYVPLQLHRSTKEQREQNMSKKFDLCVDAEGMSSETFSKVVDKAAHVVSVWARCNPVQKEDIITRLKALGHVVLMAGDGTNDVGGLKQANIGIAVLNANAVDKASTSKGESKAADQGTKDQIPGQIPMPPPLPDNAGFMDRMKYEIKIAQRKAQIQALERMNKRKIERAKANEERRKQDLANTVSVTDDQPRMEDGLSANDNSFSSLMESTFNANFDEEGSMVKLGDASIAAPFTAKTKQLMAVVDVVRMGRSTLVTTLQMYKILALNCLVTAYTMSVLHSDGVKMGDKQLVVTGIILSICFVSMSRCQPMDTLSSERPITRVFHPYMVCSIFGQFALHLYSLIASVKLVTDVNTEAINEARASIESTDFKPSLLNTIVFLMQTLMTATTFFVNYRGKPFMKSIHSNRFMFVSLVGLILLVFYFALEIDPETNEYFQIVKMPSDEFRSKFIMLLVLDMVGAYSIEKAFLLMLGNR